MKITKSKLMKMIKEAVGTGAVSTFVGKSGQEADAPAAGPFYPTDNLLHAHQDKELSTRIKRSLTDTTTSTQDLEIKETDYEYVFDKTGWEGLKEKLDKFKNKKEEMTDIVSEVEYDDNSSLSTDENKFINKTQDFKSIGD